MRRILTADADINFHFCEDSTQAIARAEEISPTVILLDLVMPNIDGLTLTRLLRDNEKTRDVPLVILSGKEEAQTKAQAFALGANDYLIKLPDPIELIARAATTRAATPTCCSATAPSTSCCRAFRWTNATAASRRISAPRPPNFPRPPTPPAPRRGRTPVLCGTR